MYISNNNHVNKSLAKFNLKCLVQRLTQIRLCNSTNADTIVIIAILSLLILINLYSKEYTHDKLIPVLEKYFIDK